MIKDREVVEDNEEDLETLEDDVETGTNTCCRGWCRQTEEQQTEHVVVHTDDLEDEAAGNDPDKVAGMSYVISNFQRRRHSTLKEEKLLMI